MDAKSDNMSQGRSPAAKLGVALVTGGRRGIGRAICLELASRGFDIGFVDVADDENVAQTQSLIAGVGRRAHFLPLDISATGNHAAIIDEMERELGAISCLVNNAGVQVSIRGDMLDVDEQEFDRLVSVNLRGTFFLTQAVARRMLETEAKDVERSIITITSANANLASPEKAAYCISKAALSMAMQNFALRLAQAGVRVHEIRPGLVRTDMTADVYERYSPGVFSGDICPMRRWGEPADIAKAIGTLASGGMPFSTGDVYNIGGGLHVSRL